MRRHMVGSGLILFVRYQVVELYWLWWFIPDRHPYGNAVPEVAAYSRKGLSFMSYVGKRAIDRQCSVNLEPDMLRGEDQDGGGGFSCGGDSPQQSSRRWENQGPLWRICYEFSVVASQLKRAEATKGDSKQVDDIVALWRKRSELAKRIVEAAASTIEDVVLKMAMTEFLLLEGDLRVGLIPQCLEECDRALAQEGDGEPCFEALERELWALCERVEHQTAALEARWDCVEQSKEVGGPNDARADFSLARAWNELNESIWSVARYETMTPVGLRAKGTMFRDLLALVGAMDGLSALQDSYLRDFDHLAYRRLHGKDSPMPRRSVE